MRNVIVKNIEECFFKNKNQIHNSFLILKMIIKVLWKWVKNYFSFIFVKRVFSPFKIAFRD